MFLDSLWVSFASLSDFPNHCWWIKPYALIHASTLLITLRPFLLVAVNHVPHTHSFTSQRLCSSATPCLASFKSSGVFRRQGFNFSGLFLLLQLRWVIVGMIVSYPHQIFWRIITYQDFFLESKYCTIWPNLLTNIIQESSFSQEPIFLLKTSC